MVTVGASNRTLRGHTHRGAGPRRSRVEHVNEPPRAKSLVQVRERKGRGQGLAVADQA